MKRGKIKNPIPSNIRASPSMREQSVIDASICGSSVSKRAYGASGEIATMVSIIALRANKQGQGATGIAGVSGANRLST